jgi:hypothetical protein
MLVKLNERYRKCIHSFIHSFISTIFETFTRIVPQLDNNLCLPTHCKDKIVRRPLLFSNVAHARPLSRVTHVPAVHDPDGERGAVDLLLWQLNVEKLDGRSKVWVLLCVSDDGRLDDVAGALDVDARFVHSHPVHALQVAQAPEKNLEPKRGKLIIKVKNGALYSGQFALKQCRLLSLNDYMIQARK